MLYCVRINLQDQMCQLWYHRFADQDIIETYCMTRLVMGKRPYTSISGVAIKEKTKLENFATRYPKARQALDQDSHVDTTNTGANTHEQLLRNIEEIEYVTKMGGFVYKLWIISGSKSPEVLFGHAGNGEHIEKNLGIL